MTEKHFVAVIGGAVSGSEVTTQLVSQGVEVVVIEQNSLPYGKITHGLPRWHGKLQKRECEKIDQKLSAPGVHYLPKCKLGDHVHLQELLDLGFSLVVLANGAWKDRPLQVPGLDEVQDDSFCYQNPFVQWFNQYDEPHYSGKTYPVKEGAVVVGGGLASIDMVKICQLEMTCARLKERGIETDVLTLEHRGIAVFLRDHGLGWDDLNLKPARLFYRRAISAMPIASAPPNATPERLEKVKLVRQKIIANGKKKYFFEVHPLRVPKKIHTRDGSVCGMTFSHSEIVDGRVKVTEQEEYVETSFVVSSVGSTPEPLAGITMKGEVYDLLDWKTGQFRDFPQVFGVGNAVTGKGNIQISLKHSRYIGQLLSDSLEATGPDYEELFEKKSQEAQEHISEIRKALLDLPKVDEYGAKKIFSFVEEWQKKRGYQGNFQEWKAKA